MITIMRKLGVGGGSFANVPSLNSSSGGGTVVGISPISSRSSFDITRNTSGNNNNGHVLNGNHHYYSHGMKHSSNGSLCAGSKMLCCNTIISKFFSYTSVTKTMSSLRSNNNTKSKTKRFEQYAVRVVIVLAWSWMVVTIGTVLYHACMGKPLPGLTTSSTETDANEVDGTSLTIQRKQSTTFTSNQRQQNNNVYQNSTTPKQLVDNTNNNYGTEKNMQQQQFQHLPHESPLIIFTCSRPDYLKETLNDILTYIPNDCSIGCPVIISQDGYNPDVTETIKTFGTKLETSKSIPIVHIQHNSSEYNNHHYNPYQKLAIHYGWALTKVFDGSATAYNSRIVPQRIIILEEDIHIAPDFFTYFKSLTSLLHTDQTLLAISAFNDNGYDSMVQNPYRLLRSDFFPGLGWMITKSIWDNELQTKWPTGYWDDWLREPKQRRGRQFIRPEISRTYHFGTKGGASSNQFGSSLSKIKLNTVPIDWNQYNTSNLFPSEYNVQYYELIRLSHKINMYQDAITYLANYFVTNKNDHPKNKKNGSQTAIRITNFRIEYKTFEEFQYLVHTIEPYHLMDDEKAGVPRTSYKGVVETRIPLSSFGIVVEPTTTTTTTSSSSYYYSLDNNEKVLVATTTTNNNNDVTTSNSQDQVLYELPILFLTPPLDQLEKDLLRVGTSISNLDVAFF